MDLDDDDDDFFGDDDLDDISAEAFAALESNAIQFTQAVAQQQRRGGASQTRGESESQSQIPYHARPRGQQGGAPRFTAQKPRQQQQHHHHQQQQHHHHQQQHHHHHQQHHQQHQQQNPQQIQHTNVAAQSRYDGGGARHAAGAVLHPQQVLHDFGDDFCFEDDDLDTTEVTNELAVPAGRPIGDKSLPQQAQKGPPPRYAPPQQPQFRAPQVQSTRPPASQYARPALPPHAQRFSQSTQQLNQYHPSQAQPLSQHPPDMVSALQLRLRALESELSAARGEVAIIRSNSTKAQRAHEEEVAYLRRHAQEQLSEREKAMEAAVAAHRTASTDLEFLRQDVREANSRAARVKKQQEAAEAAAAAGMTTPKKTLKQWRSEAAGFDDLDMLPMSPSKRGRRGYDRTPGKGKRKRDLLDSPTGALDLDTDGDRDRDRDRDQRGKDQERGKDQGRDVGKRRGAVTKGRKDWELGDGRDSEMEVDMEVEMEMEMVASMSLTDARPASPPPPTFEYLLLILDHGTPSAPPTFESLAQLSLPSAPSASLAQLILHKLPLMGDPHRPMQLLVDFAEFTIGLWGQCYDEGVLYPAAGHLVALLEFILQLHATTVAPLVIRSVIPVAVASLYVVVEGRTRGVELEGVDSTRALGLLYMLAQTCASLPGETGAMSPIATFWSLMPMDMLYPLFSPRQRLDDILGTLDLLATSSLPTSIGPVVEDAEKDAVGRSLINHVSAKLVEVSRCTVVAADRHRLRLAALRTLSSFVTSDHGAVAVASHESALPRLVALLSASLDELYDMDMSPDHLGEDDAASVFRIITNATLLLHALVTAPPTAGVADVQAKLAASHGGSQRYLVALARLNFAEDDILLEAGIGAEASGCAHELLELAVTMDEGEEISEAFLKWE